MYQNKIFKAILLLGGKSERFSENALKQNQFLCGKKVYRHTLDHFLEIPYFDEIILVCHEKCLKEVSLEIEKSQLAIPIKIIAGGTSRQHSSYLGLKACGEKTDFVVIHDAVRPLISSKIIFENIIKVIDWKAVDTCIPTADTLIQIKNENEIQSIPDRSLFRRGQTPQSFSYSLILQAHEWANQQGIHNRTDDCQIVLEKGDPVYFVKGDESNIKITTELDLFIADQLLRLSKSQLISPQERCSLKGKKYAVIGGTGGIGAAICQRVEDEGAIALSLSRHSNEFPLDIADPRQIESLFNRLFNQYGEIDGLINSAGILKVKELEHLSIEEIQEMLNVNLHGVIFSCRSAKIKEGGHIINIASSSYSRGRPQYSIYSCAKAAVVNFTQAFSEENPHLNVNAIVPHRTKTPLRMNNFSMENEQDLLCPQQVAEEIVKLLKCSRLTGAIIEIKKQHEN